MKQSSSKIKSAILILSIMLAISLTALGVLLLYSLLKQHQTTVVVPDNIISVNQDAESENGKNTGADDSSDKDPEATENVTSGEEAEPVGDLPGTSDNDGALAENADNTPVPEPSTSFADNNDSEEKVAVVLRLFENQYTDNSEYYVSNMFPGDVETKYFCLQVSYKDSIVLKHHADIRPGYEKLAEVLKCRISVLGDSEPLYDGLMKDMPESLDHEMSSAESKTEYIYYQIDVYLDTSVGNEYQMKTLIADFRWWVEGDNLQPPPQTGDNNAVIIWSVIAVSALIMIIALVVVSRKKERKTYE